MIKLKDIISENISSRKTFTTIQQEIDPETGKISWDVKYHHAKELEKGLINVQERMELLIRQNPKDLKLIELYDLYRKYKKSLNTHLNTQYPKK
jgi:hypothetical protein